MLKKILLPTVVISGTLFASFMLLLALQGSKPVKVQLGEQELFYGELKDVVTPGVGAAFSFGLGLAGAVLWTWQKSLRQSSDLESQLSNLQKQISEKDSQIHTLKVSPSSPMLSQLRWFLDEDESKVQTAVSTANTSPKQTAPRISTKNPEQATFSQAVTKPLVITSTEYETQPITVSQLTAQTATSTLPSAQSALGFTQRYGKRVDA